MDAETVSVRQAAAIFGITTDAVRKRIKRGLLQSVRDKQGHILVCIQTFPGQDNTGNSQTQSADATQNTQSADNRILVCPDCIKLSEKCTALTAQNEALTALVNTLTADRDDWKAQAKSVLQTWNTEQTLSIQNTVRDEIDKLITKEAPRSLWARIRDAIKPHKE